MSAPLILRQVLERFYEAERRYLQAGGASFEEFAATMAPNVVLHQTPGLPWGGEYVGPQDTKSGRG